MAYFFGPGPRFVVAPVAQTEYDGATGGFQGFAHGGIGAHLIQAFGVAPVVLQIVDAPRGVGQGVLVLVAPRSEEHTSELQSRPHLVCRLLLEKKKNESIDSRRSCPQ